MRTSGDIEKMVHNLVEVLTQDSSVRAIGSSGGERPWPEPGQGDIDLFVYCTEIPVKDQRSELLRSFQVGIERVEIGKMESGHWGPGDCLWMAGVETWLLYFTFAEARQELNALLSGKHLGRADDYYYPMGRLAMWKTMHVFYDPDGLLQSFKRDLEEYPQALADMVVAHHLPALRDVEDLERAVQRKDLLFFHFALDLALDHFLQTLFALNKEFFPSRKRSESYLQRFRVKPLDCASRLRQVVAGGGKVATLEQSYRLWEGLVQDLEGLVKNG